ncbi:response regulator [Domibacillus sp. DTU_2020_1001157_1_SI_ALB_TIR_016]|uniref:response regulator transcription factor n=1 Tax=Domibacillus sp. DTU_2020_1001157_1_SI_ALB_TIR_016 TaxID=3077789 RepID=UPI0028E8008E|nr:response regulator [Domibacillus sp. DTU_2020_1001157_1_SI_ALB_TIR_016]WNS77919.1 response regulator [Domibacillus sp. DTU_2020_1001157_1_SI_ALB_TIR_016]
MTTLLIVDDEHWTRDTVKTLVDQELWGISQLDEAENGEQAIEKIQKKCPDIIITDMKMPGIDGIGLLDVLKNDYPEIPVIVLSGYQDFMYTRQAIKAKAVEYLPKPVDREELNQAFGKAIMEKRKLEQQQISYPLFAFKQPAISSLLDPFYATLAFSLKELNEKQFESTVEQFLAELPENLKQNEAFHFRFHQQFLVLMEEVMKQHNVTLEELGFERKDFMYDPAVPIETELINMQAVGKTVIQKIREGARQKTRINLDDIKYYIEENYSSPELSLGMISKKFYVSKEYLTTAFKKKFGCNITEFIIEYRMNKAKELVQTTTLQYKTISSMIGYEDVSYFYRLFKKVHGSSPGSVRKD